MCVNRCIVSAPEWMTEESFYDTLELCCEARHNWVGQYGLEECKGLTPAPTGTPGEPTLSPSQSPVTQAPVSCKFYSLGNADLCRDRCIVSAPEWMSSEEWFYDTLEACCLARHNWVGPSGKSTIAFGPHLSFSASNC